MNQLSSEKKKTAIAVLLILPILYWLGSYLVSLLIPSLPFIFRLRDQLVAFVDLELWLAYYLLLIKHDEKSSQPRISFYTLPAILFVVLNIVLFAAINWYLTSDPSFSNLVHVTIFFKSFPYLIGLLIVLLVVQLFFRFRHPLARFWGRSLVTWQDQTIWNVKPNSARTNQMLLWMLFFIGVGIRLVNLGNFPPYSDEDNHTHVAIQMLNNESINYFRSFLTVTLPVYLSFLTFGVGWFQARLPMVLINMAGIFPLYHLGKKMNHQIGLFAAFLYTTSPWIIASSRTVREYAIIPFFLYLSASLLIELADFQQPTLKIYLQKHWTRLTIAGLLLIYILFVDQSSLINIIPVNYLSILLIVFLMVVLRDFNKIPRWTWLSLLSIVGLVVGFIFRRLAGFAVKGNFFQLRYQDKFLESMFENPYQNWFAIPEINFLIFLLVAVVTIRAMLNLGNKKNQVPLMLNFGLAAMVILLSFLLFSTRFPVRMRYGILIEYFYVPATAISLWFFVQSLKRSFCVEQSKSINTVMVILLGLFINISSISGIWQYQGGPAHFITGNNHYRGFKAYQTLTDLVQEGDVLLTSSFGYYDEMNGYRLNIPRAVHFKEVFTRGKSNIEDALINYPSGWVVLFPDDYPESYGFIYSDFIAGNTKLSYYGLIEDAAVWRWEPVPQ